MKRKGFSLIELMVVIAIAAILAAIAVPVYNKFVFRAQISSIVSLLQSLGQQSMRYYSIKGRFPTAKQLGYATYSCLNYQNQLAASLAFSVTPSNYKSVQEY